MGVPPPRLLARLTDQTINSKKASSHTRVALVASPCSHGGAALSQPAHKMHDGSMGFEMQTSGLTANEWQRGFTHGTQLSCDVCAAVVPKTPTATAKHRDWHATLDQRRSEA